MNEPHHNSAELAYLTSDEISSKFRDGSLTSLVLVDALLERMSIIDPPEGAVGLSAIAAIADDARDQALRCDRERVEGSSRGTLHGIPVLIKDNIEALGLPGFAGSSAIGAVAQRDAELVRRLRESGAIILASTNLSEWANMRSPRSSSGWSATGGLVGNPWSLDRSAGGSSSGSGAALAAGFAPLAVGTETDGSIVCPASLNGVVGLKPTVGVVPATQVVPISASQDSPGPMGRRVADVARLFAVLSSQEAPQETELLPCVVATNWRTGHQPTDDVFDDVVARLRAGEMELIDRAVALPGSTEGDDELTVLLCELRDDLSSYLAARPGSHVQSLAEVIVVEDKNRAIEQPYFGHEFFTMALATGGRAATYAAARERNVTWANDVCLTPAIEGAGVILAPAYGPAWKSDLIVGGHPAIASVATMAPAIAGWPILSLPMGFVHDMPVGLALIARPGEEWLLLATAARIESLVALDSKRRPEWRVPRRG